MNPGPAISKLRGDGAKKQPVRKEERKIARRDNKQVKAWLRSKPLRIASQLTEKNLNLGMPMPQSKDWLEVPSQLTQAATGHGSFMETRDGFTRRT